MNHSTVDTFLAYAFQTVEEQNSSFSDAHDWLSSFWAKTQHAARLPPTANRPALPELMKTPARKRAALSSINVSSNLKEKDPVATMLFSDSVAPTAAAKPKPANKENSSQSDKAVASKKGKQQASQATRLPSPRAVSPKKASRPVSPSQPAPVRSVLSPRKAPTQQSKLPSSPQKAKSPPANVAPRSDANTSKSQTSAVLDADLSIIGEEDAEGEQSQQQSFASKKPNTNSDRSTNKAVSPPRDRSVDKALESPKAAVASSSPAGGQVQSFAAAGAAMRPSLASNRTLTFVGLPKKSLGLGLGLGRSMNPSAQPSWTASQASGSESQSQSSTVASQPPTTGSKRKSLEPLEGTAKMARVDASAANKVPETAEDAARARREEMARRLEAMRARQSGRPSLGKSTGPSNAFSSIISPPATTKTPAPQPITTSTKAVNEITRPLSPALKHVQGATSIPRPLSPAPRTALPMSPRMQSFNFAESPKLAPNLPGSPRAKDQPGVRRVSVNEMIKNFEKAAASTSRLPMLSPTRTAIGSPRIGAQASAKPAASAGSRPQSPIAEPVQTSPVTRSMARALQSPSQSLRAPQSTTPAASPKIQQAASFSATSALAGLGIEGTEAMPSKDSTDALDSIREEEPRVSLPAPIAQEDDTAEIHAETDQASRPVVVVEKGQGTLASALDRGESAPQPATKLASTTVPRINVPRHKDQQPIVEDFDSMFGLPQQQKFRPQQPASSLHAHAKLSHSSISSQASSHTSVLSKVSLGGGPIVKKAPSSEIKQKSTLLSTAAKKEQLEKDKKNALKQRNEEDTKKRIEALDRKRKEREEAAMANANKLKAVVKSKPKVEDEPAKKRKIDTTEPLKKSENGKPTAGSSAPLNRSMPSSHSSSNLASSQGRMGPPASTSAHKGLTASTSSKFLGDQIRAVNGPSSGAPRLAPTAPKPFAFSTSTSSHKLAQQLQQKAEPEPPIELPDIDSEYSDSDDEEGRAAKLKAMPDWAHSPQLTEALYRQSRINPDDIFGDIQPLSMKEIFRTSSAKWHKRTSSACWDGVDALSEADKKRYNARMGFSNSVASGSTRQ